MKEIKAGMKSSAETEVNKENLAVTIGSGSLEVFATPMMAALMENAASKAVAAALENDETTVGTMLNITHTSATPVGMKDYRLRRGYSVEWTRNYISCYS